jgi:hypothetical protein
MIAIQPVYWRVGRIYRKHSFFYCCVLDRVVRAVAWQRVDQIRYNIYFQLICRLFLNYRLNILPPLFGSQAPVFKELHQIA